MHHPRDLVPPGRHRAVLIGRTKSPSSSSGGTNPSGQSHIDLLFQLSGSSVPGRQLKHRVWAESSKARARRLKQDQEIVVVVQVVTLDSGHVVNRVIDFHAANEPSVIEAMTAEGDATVVTKRPLVAAADPVLPVELWQRLMTSGTSSETKPGPATILAATLPVGADAGVFEHGFLRVGDKGGHREIVDYEATLSDYATHSGLPPSRARSPGYLSVFQYAADIADHWREHEGRLKGYRGKCWARWLAVDFDGDGTPEGLQRALDDTLRFSQFLIDRGVPGEKVLVFFSGGRGFHLLFPSACCGAGAKVGFEGGAGIFCKGIAELVKATIDPNIYKPLASLRAPNTPHDKSGFYKVLLPQEELEGLDAVRVMELAREPRHFEMPSWRMKPVAVLIDLWMWSCHAEGTQTARLTAAIDGERRIFRDTFDFLVHGAPDGQRGTRLFRAAANLLDFDAPEALLRALLEPAARLSGYPPEDFDAQINGALAAHQARPTTPN
jgi:hypothetical protein